MTFIARTCFIFVALALTACSSPPDQRLSVPKVPVKETQRIAYSTVALREVSLPTYAGSEDVYMADDSGLLNLRPGFLWADDPNRAITLELTRYLTQITGAQVAAAPWPFGDYPQAEIELRIEDMLARADGTFRLSGQYFVSPENGRDRARLFDLSVPIPVADDMSGIAQARGQAVRTLALEIARNGLR